MSEFSKIITSDMLDKGGPGVIVNALIRVPGVQIIGGYVTTHGPSGFATSAATEPMIVMDGTA
ncbi:MAG: hypothetical protein WKG06_41005 [Segetibacter sp.]